MSGARLPATPGQTIGPFFHYALPYPGDRDLVPPGSAGSIVLHGHVSDGSGDPVTDALVELWQLNPEGAAPQSAGSLRRDGFTFTGWGRCSTDLGGHYWFTTLQPGAHQAARAPFFALTVFARGLLDRLYTRAYLPGPRTESDAFLATLTDAQRASLLAQSDPTGFRFDIRLQGARETTFLAFRYGA